MPIRRGSDDFDPVRALPVVRVGGRHEERRTTGAWLLAQGTLSCPRCDAPVAPASGPLTPASPLACPYCRHAGVARDFLSLEPPSRPARVDVRIVLRGRGAERPRSSATPA